MVTGDCDLCSRPAAVEVDVRHRLFWGGWRIKTWTVCTPHRDVLVQRVTRLADGWTVVAERKTGGGRP